MQCSEADKKIQEKRIFEPSYYVMTDYIKGVHYKLITYDKNIKRGAFKFDELPEDTVRLSASTIEQLFKDTNYSLSEVRRTKKVKPIRLSLLPNEMKSIESSGKRKSLFIKIILPLVEAP